MTFNKININSHHMPSPSINSQLPWVFPKHLRCHRRCHGQSAVSNVGSDVSTRLDDDAKRSLQEVSPEAELKRFFFEIFSDFTMFILYYFKSYLQIFWRVFNSFHMISLILIFCDCVMLDRCCRFFFMFDVLSRISCRCDREIFREHWAALIYF